jgi:methyl-accepting chemotaxis protein
MLSNMKIAACLLTEIAEQIASVPEETRTAVASMGGIASTITQITELTTAIAGAVEDLGVVAAEIARSVEKSSQNTRDVTGNIAGVAQEAAAETGRMPQGVFHSPIEVCAESHLLECEAQRFLSYARGD